MRMINHIYNILILITESMLPYNLTSRHVYGFASGLMVFLRPWGIPARPVGIFLPIGDALLLPSTLLPVG